MLRFRVTTVCADWGLNVPLCAACGCREGCVAPLRGGSCVTGRDRRYRGAGPLGAVGQHPDGASVPRSSGWERQGCHSVQEARRHFGNDAQYFWRSHGHPALLSLKNRQSTLLCQEDQALWQRNGCETSRKMLKQ